MKIIKGSIESGEYIHFKSKEECDAFKNVYRRNYTFGNTCCTGKGVKIVDSDEHSITSIRREWKKIWKVEQLKKEEAARVIQKFWKEHAWNPQFSLCRRLYFNRLEEFGIRFMD